MGAESCGTRRSVQRRLGRRGIWRPSDRPLGAQDRSTPNGVALPWCPRVGHAGCGLRPRGCCGNIARRPHPCPPLLLSLGRVKCQGRWPRNLEQSDLRLCGIPWNFSGCRLVLPKSFSWTVQRRRRLLAIQAMRQWSLIAVLPKYSSFKVSGTARVSGPPGAVSAL